MPGLRGRPADRPPRPARDDRVGLREVRPVLQDLVVLTPPLLVCVAFLVAVVAFVRHEMGASRRHREQHAPDEISGDRTIPDSESTEAAAQSHDVDATGGD